MIEGHMTKKIFAMACLGLGILASPSVASAAHFSRGMCINAVHEKLGDRATDAGTTSNKAAVSRCMRHGPGAI